MTLKLVIDEDDALKGLRYAVKTKGPGYLYESPIEDASACVYVAEDGDGALYPACIGGVALYHLGVPLEMMYPDGNDESIAGLAETLKPRGYVITRGAIAVIRAAQQVQDAALKDDMDEESRARLRARFPDASWGAALRAAHNKLMEMRAARVSDPAS